jgi:Na+/H+-dicarboxylate symporter
MFRTMTNVVGNALATSVVSKWEGELKPEQLPVTGSQVPGITQH